jgi:hypothetical protein
MASRTAASAAEAETRRLREVPSRPSSWTGEEEGEPAEDPRPDGPQEAAAKPATSIVINGTVHAPNAIFGTHNSYGTQNYYGGRDERA